MGRKKGKNTKQQQNEECDDESTAISTKGTVDDTTDITMSEQQKGGGKKARRKQFDDDDIDSELLAIAEEGMEKEVKSKENVTPPTSHINNTSGDKENWKVPVIETMNHDLPKVEGLPHQEEISEIKQDEKGGKKNKKGKKMSEEDEDIDQLIKEIDSGGDPTGATQIPLPKEEEEEETFHLMTKAEKKAAKKERQKEISKKKKVNNTQTEETVIAEDDTMNPTEEVVVNGATPLDNIEGDLPEDDDDKKKKKKKKKKTEEDKKSTNKSKKVKVAVMKMKEEIEALRAAQKKREEEELSKLREAEEAEKQRLENLRLEKERKEKRKQKEKERRERLKKEGKLLTKSEKEKRAKQAVQLQALIDQGIVVPQKSSIEGQDEQKKKPIRYGSRVRPKKHRSNEEGINNITTTSETQVDSKSLSDEGSSVSMSEDLTEDHVKDNWDDEDEEEEVKDNWDDEEVSASVDEMGVVNDPPKTVENPVAMETTSAISSDEEKSDSDDDEEEEEDEDLTPYDKAAKRIKDRRARHNEERTPELLRSPVVCVLGHVDTGKTKILDKIRHTHVQDGEAGGITQQIGATFVPEDAIREQTTMLKEFSKSDINLPGLLIIDTPGHESFSNLRTRGSSMCDIAILVVDIMHGLEPQTIESLNLLRKGSVPMVVALNKIDRLFDWRRNPTSGVKETLKKQKPNTKAEFDERMKEVIIQFAEQGLNAALFWDRVDFKEYIPVVPTSAVTGDGMGDLIAQVVGFSKKMLQDQLMFSKEVEAVVLEVKVIYGLGTTVDIILRNGILNEGDSLILNGTEGPFVTQARALLMPQPLKELRVKNSYINHKTIIAAQGVKICGKDLEKTIAGTPVLVARKPDEIDVLKDEAASTLSNFLGAIKLKDKGVFVQASTLGSLEALLEFLKGSKIPFAGINIGPVHKKDVMKASVMLDKDNQWACILAFDVRVERDAQEMADSVGVRIFTADIIYHLFDNFIKYREELRERKRQENERFAIFPCKLKILPNCVFNARNPIVVGVLVEAGIVKPGTPLCVPSRDFINIGTVSSLELNHKQVENARKGTEVCIKIEAIPGEPPKLFGRHFDLEDVLVSKISRESIDAVKSYFREDLQKSDWQLMIELKRTFQIF